MPNKRKMTEYTFTTEKKLTNPFWDGEVFGVFSHEKGAIKQKVLAFYDGHNSDGQHIWKLRWNPTEAGMWNCTIYSKPQSLELDQSFDIFVEESEKENGFLRVKPGEEWGYYFDNGKPCFLFGDTMYNLFGAHYSGVDVKEILENRKSQGINYIRARLQVSPYHPQTKNQWQTKDLWPWGGSAQRPDFSRFNLDYFKAVDEIVSYMSDINMGLEMIMQAWLWEFPWNDRSQFVPEYEELWTKYIIARFSAFPSVYIWCPANEYEFYPHGINKYNREADPWIKRLSSMIKKHDPYKHPVGIQNWVKDVPLHERVGDHKDIDVYLVQTSWDKERKQQSPLCPRVESDLRDHSPDKDKAVMCSEFGYEKTEGLFTAPGHEHMDHHHTRRGQWRSGFSGCPVVHGFNNTWGAHMRIDKESIGTKYLLPYYHFMNKEISYYEMKPTTSLIGKLTGTIEEGTKPSCLTNDDLSVIAIYFPTDGEITINMKPDHSYEYIWFDPRTGNKSTSLQCTRTDFKTATATEEDPWGEDWILLLKKVSN